jgi:hypothetical protein
MSSAYYHGGSHIMQQSFTPEEAKTMPTEAIREKLDLIEEWSEDQAAHNDGYRAAIPEEFEVLYAEVRTRK